MYKRKRKRKKTRKRKRKREEINITKKIINLNYQKREKLNKIINKRFIIRKERRNKIIRNLVIIKDLTLR